MVFSIKKTGILLFCESISFVYVQARAKHMVLLIADGWLLYLQLCLPVPQVKALL
jgi:hypothetical protein